MRYIILVLCLLVGCVQNESTVEQGLCTVDDPGCQTAWHLTYTRNRAYSDASTTGVAAMGAYSGCYDSNNVCWTRVELADGSRVETTCFWDGQQSSCSSDYCPAWAGDSNDWCTPI